MNIRQLQIFQAVAMNASFSRAAVQIHMAQPAVSIAIRKLEEQLDLQLFVRTHHQTYMTAEGEALLVHADRLLHQFRVAEDEMDDLRGLEKGLVRFSTTAMLGSYFFPPVIAAFQSRHPGIRLEVINEGARGVQQLLDSGQIDMGVVNLDEIGQELDVCPLLHDEVVACVADGHSLAKRNSLPMEQFLKQPLVLYGKNYYLRQLVDGYSKDLNQPLNISLETDLLGMIIGLVRDCKGATIALRSAAQREPGLVPVPFERSIFLSLGMAWKRNGHLSLANRAFLEFLQQH